MLEISQLTDGKFAVRDSDTTELDDVLGVFDTREEADEFLLGAAIQQDERTSGLGLFKPGD